MKDGNSANETCQHLHEQIDKGLIKGEMIA